MIKTNLNENSNVSDREKHYFEISEMKYNKDYLLELSQNVYRSNYTYPKKNGQEVFGMTWLPFNNTETERIRRMVSLHLSSAYLVILQAGCETGFHTDDDRGSTLIFPLSNELEFCYKKNEQEVSNYYSVPIITNSRLSHNAKNHTSLERINVLFHISESYENVYKEYKNGKLLNMSLDTHLALYKGLCHFPKNREIEMLFKKKMGLDIFDVSKDTYEYIRNFDFFVSDSVEFLSRIGSKLGKDKKDLFLFSNKKEIDKKIDKIIYVSTPSLDKLSVEALKFILDSPYKFQSLSFD